jgi:hypothetical protein
MQQRGSHDNQRSKGARISPQNDLG